MPTLDSIPGGAVMQIVQSILGQPVIEHTHADPPTVEFIKLMYMSLSPPSPTLVYGEINRH